MLFSSVISSLILLESREVGLSMISQPFIISLLLIFLGYDPYYVLFTATATHLFFIHYIPSGASKYPEYPFAFFVVLSASKDITIMFENNSGSLILFSFVLIVILSRLTVFYIYYKRKLLEKLLSKNFLNPGELKVRDNLILHLAYSFISGIILSFILLFLSNWIFKYFSYTLEHIMPVNDLLLVIVSGIFIPYFVSKNKIKASAIGLIAGIIFITVKG